MRPDRARPSQKTEPLAFNRFSDPVATPTRRGSDSAGREATAIRRLLINGEGLLSQKSPAQMGLRGRDLRRSRVNVLSACLGTGSGESASDLGDASLGRSRRRVPVPSAIGQ
jgi:hypothetical protein